MRKRIELKEDWKFVKKEESLEEAFQEEGERVSLPHTWNAIDGQDGGGDYLTGAFFYFKEFDKPQLEEGESLYLEVEGANSVAEVYLNGKKLFTHKGGYSLFRVNLTSHIQEGKNLLAIRVSNKSEKDVYPQKADFTFYGGLYRGVSLLIVSKVHFDLDYYGDPGIKVDTSIDGKDGLLTVSSFGELPAKVKIEVYDKENKLVAEGNAKEAIKITNVHLWNGKEDPYLYTVKAYAYEGEEASDEVDTKVGFRTFALDPKNGFILNGRSYPLRGVAMHQDFAGIGNAITHKEIDESLAQIDEIGATTVRLAHYQHSEYTYARMDELGIVVWSEVPYISKHAEEGNENILSQMKELIVQTYNHPSIVFRSLSNEITMKGGKGKKAFHFQLNKMIHEMDPSRVTTMANFATMMALNPFSAISDSTAMNFYHGWYTPFTFLNGLRLSFYHLCHPKKPLGFSEYGAEGLINLHSEKPKRGDDSEEYQLLCHAKIYKALDKRKYLFGTYVWNMFDFGADARNIGGDPGKNHKGLVTFDRKTRKDAFYLYQAYWSKKEVLHLCGHRFLNRALKKETIYLTTNAPSFRVLQDGKEIFSTTNSTEKFYSFKIDLTKDSLIEAISPTQKDSLLLHKVDKPDPSYILIEKSNNASWEKKKK